MVATDTLDKRDADAPLTFVFTDLVDYTPLLRRLGERGERLRREHFERLDEALETTGGRRVKSVGDGIMAVFSSPSAALRCAVHIQRDTEAHNRRRSDATLSVRVGVHVGEASHEDGDYYGLPVVVASRLCARAQGGQVLVSELVRQLAGTPARIIFEPLGPLQLKGLDDEVVCFAVHAADSRPRRGAPRRRGQGDFAGRNRELEVLAQEASRAAGGELRVALVTADAGAGKSRLVSEASSRLQEEVTVLSARAHNLSGTASFGLWVEALERHLRELPAEDVRELAGPAAAELAPLLRSVEAGRAGRPSRETTHYRLVQNLSALVGAIAATGQLVVVLDDVHLADSASWDVLRYVAQDLAAAPLLVLATARPDELAAHAIAQDVVFALEQEGTLRAIRLEPLARADLDELARMRTGRPSVPAALVSWLHDRSRGNALFAVGLLSALTEENADLDRPALERLPENLADRINSRLRDLDADPRSVLELLAVVGARTDLRDLARLAGLSVDRLAVALEDVVKRRLAVEDESGGVTTYEIAHPLVQDAIYDGIGRARRALLHRSIGRTLLATGLIASAAAHLAKSAEPGDPEAIAALTNALALAESRALYREANAVLAQLVELLPPGDERWVGALDAMDPRAEWVLAHLTEDHASEVIDALRRIEDVVERRGDERRLAVVQLRLACVSAVGTNDLESATSAGRRAVGLLERVGERELALAARTELGYLDWIKGDRAGAIARFRTILDEAQPEDVLPTLHALGGLGRALEDAGEIEAMLAVAQRGIAISREHGSGYRTALFTAGLAGMYAESGRALEAPKLLETAVRDNAAAADAMVNERAVQVWWLVGDLARARKAAALAAERNRTRVSVRQAWAIALGVRCAIEAGERAADVEGTLSACEKALAGWNTGWGIWPAWTRGILAWSRGDRDAVERARLAAESLVWVDVHPDVAFALADTAEAAAELGDPDTSTWAAGQLADLSARATNPLYAPLASMSAAFASPSLDTAEGAAAAAELFGVRGYALFAGRAHLARGRALVRSDQAAAVTALRAAVDKFTACGAAWHAARTTALLRRLGSRGKRAARVASGPDGLSEREREVALLAVKGMTATEIADALFISARTVETHLASAYSILGVRSKRELTRRASELGLE